MTIQPGEVVALVPTGLAIARAAWALSRRVRAVQHAAEAWPDGREWGVGIVDSDYCGPRDEVKIQVVNFTTQPVTVRRGD